MSSSGTLMPAVVSLAPFPRTRYQGSKRKLAAAIVEQLRDLEFTTVLDAFGGTGAVAYALKQTGKQVTYNDILGFNHQIGLALIENDSVQLGDDEIESIGVRRRGVIYDDFIQRTFAGIYFTDEENEWLDIAVGNARRIENRYSRALAWFALFQSAMVKRPYNLFHRSNLYMRTADVTRSFGNKATWDRSFQTHFRRFANDANAALIDSDGTCRAICRDALDVEPGFDLVYIDRPTSTARASAWITIISITSWKGWSVTTNGPTGSTIVSNTDPWHASINRGPIRGVAARCFAASSHAFGVASSPSPIAVTAPHPWTNLQRCCAK